MTNFHDPNVVYDDASALPYFLHLGAAFSDRVNRLRFAVGFVKLLHVMGGLYM